MTLPKNKKLPRRPIPSKGPVQMHNEVKPAQMRNNLKDGKGGKDKDGKDKKKKKGLIPTARRLANISVRDEVQDFRKERRGIRREARNERNIARRDYKRGLGDLKHIFGETGDYIGQLNQQTQGMYGQAGNQQAAATQALQQALGQSYSGAQANAQAELGRLGIQGGGDFSQFAADAANAQGTAMQAGAMNQGTLDIGQANAQAFGQLLMGMNQGSYMSHAGKNLNARNDALAEIRQNKLDNYNKIREGISDARGGRRDLFFQLLQQLKASGWGKN